MDSKLWFSTRVSRTSRVSSHSTLKSPELTVSIVSRAKRGYERLQSLLLHIRSSLTVPLVLLMYDLA